MQRSKGQVYEPFDVSNLIVTWGSRDPLHFGAATVKRQGNLLRLSLHVTPPSTKALRTFQEAIEEAADARKPLVVVMFSVDGEMQRRKAVVTRCAGHTLHLGLWGSEKIWQNLPPRPQIH